MIKISNLNISFKNKKIIENSSFTLEKGRITVITGKSGTGKSCVLYSAGLISSQKNYNYYYNKEKIHIKNDKICSNFRKSKIGYIFQDNSLLDKLNIKDNILFSALMADRKLSENELKKILNELNVEVDLSLHPKNLSGGELQRVAIACALVKNPDIIIADEPTSSLDIKNSRIIIDILKKIAHSYNKIVFIATHDSRTIENCDKVYAIENNQINLVTDTHVNLVHEKQNINITSNATNRVSLFKKYIKKINKRRSAIQKIFNVICILVFVLTFLNTYLSKNKIIRLNEEVDSTVSNEIFLVNQKENHATFYCENNNNAFFKKDIIDLEKMDNISNVFPFFTLGSQGNVYENNDINHINKSIIRIKDDNKNEWNTPYHILPIYDTKKIENHLYQNSPEDSGVYISYRIAEQLRLVNRNLENVSIIVSLFVPQSEQSLNGESVVIGEFQKAEFRVSGILAKDYTNNYIEQIDSISNKEHIILVNHTSINDLIENNRQSFNIKGIEEGDIQPRALVLVADSYKNIGKIFDSLELYNKNFKFSANLKSASELEFLTISSEASSKLITLLILIITSLMLFIIKINYTMSRKYEFAILRCNGFSKKELSFMVILENIIQILKIFIVASVLMIITETSLVHILNYAYTGMLNYIFSFLLLTACFLVPTAVSLIILNKFNPDNILRS